jgi:CubicO group peptidase (beta-lactamase class C family)
MATALGRTHAVLEGGLRTKLHVGAQLHVSQCGETRADLALGLAAPERPMTPDSMMTWLSCSKIATSILFARLWEQGLFDLDHPVARHLPEFAANGKDAITIRQVWTHTCGLLALEQRLFALRYRQPHAQNMAMIYAALLDPGVRPGTRAGYQTSVVALVLGEIASRKRDRDFRELVRGELFLPLGMHDSWLGMSEPALTASAPRLGQTFDTSGPEPKPRSAAPDTPAQLTAVMPGGNGRGPMRELARLLELLRCRGTLDGVRMLAPTTVEALTARQRCGLHDHTFGQVLDWGLGLLLDSKLHHAGATHLYGYGPYASPRSFGHSGFRTTLAFCDPEHDLTVACSWNGLVASDAVHSERQNALCAAIYEDLGLA